MSKVMILILAGAGIFGFLGLNSAPSASVTSRASLSVVSSAHSSSHNRAGNQALARKRHTAATKRAFWHKLRIFVEKMAFHNWILAISIPYHTGTVNGYACGGALPPCYVLYRESKGDPYAVNPGHMGAPYGDPGDPWHYASGLFQDIPSTWNYWDGYPYAAAAPVNVQYKMNALLWNNGSGCSHWEAC